MDGVVVYESWNRRPDWPVLLSLGSATVEVLVLTVGFEISVSCCHYWPMLLSEQKSKYSCFLVTSLELLSLKTCCCCWVVILASFTSMSSHFMNSLPS